MPPKRPSVSTERRETSPLKSLLPFPALMEMLLEEARGGVRRGTGAMEKAEASSAAPHRARAYIGAEYEYISVEKKCRPSVLRSLVCRGRKDALSRMSLVMIMACMVRRA